MAIIGAHMFRQSLTDRCYIDERSTGSEWGSARGEVTYTPGSEELACRLVSHNTLKVLGDAGIPLVDASIWLPASVEVEQDDHIRVTEQWKYPALPERTYTVLSFRQHGYGNEAVCREVKGGSAR
jgi:hypothetical protein